MKSRIDSRHVVKSCSTVGHSRLLVLYYSLEVVLLSAHCMGAKTK